MKPVVYILYFKEKDRYYVGSTDDLQRRIAQHKAGHTPSTKRLGRDFTVAFSQEVETLQIARRTEYRIKNWKRRDFIEQIINDGVIQFLQNTGQ